MKTQQGVWQHVWDTANSNTFEQVETHLTRQVEQATCVVVGEAMWGQAFNQVWVEAWDQANQSRK